MTYSASQDLPPTSLSLPKQPGISIKKHEPVGGNIADSSHDRDISLFCVPALEDVSVIFKKNGLNCYFSSSHTVTHVSLLFIPQVLIDA